MTFLFSFSVSLIRDFLLVGSFSGFIVVYTIFLYVDCNYYFSPQVSIFRSKVAITQINCQQKASRGWERGKIYKSLPTFLLLAVTKPQAVLHNTRIRRKRHLPVYVFKRVSLQVCRWPVNLLIRFGLAFTAGLENSSMVLFYSGNKTSFSATSLVVFS